MKQFRTRISIAFGEDDDANLRTIKAHYGISSNAAAIRRAIAEHAKQLSTPQVESKRVVLSRRVY